MPNDVSAVVIEICAWSALDGWCTAWMMSVSADKSEMLAHRCTPHKDSILLRKYPIACEPTILDLGPNYPTSLNFSEHVATQCSQARRDFILILRTTKLSDSIVSIYKTRSTTLVCGILLFSRTSRANGIAIESLQRRFTKQVVG